MLCLSALSLATISLPSASLAGASGLESDVSSWFTVLTADTMLVMITGHLEVSFEELVEAYRVTTVL